MRGEVPLATVETAEITVLERARIGRRAMAWRGWYGALQAVFPIYAAAHLALLALSYLATLFVIPNFSPKSLPLSALVHSWNRWDTSQYTAIADHGYDGAWRTAFFPVFPMLEHGLAVIVRDSFIAGLIVANLAGLAMLVVLYRLVQEDFDAQRAERAVLYLAVFPTAFFFSAAYNEGLFLLLALLCFYAMRHQQWWLAGLCGFVAAPTRSTGVLLLLPFCYEYLRQRRFNPRALRLDALSAALIPIGLGLYMLYCYRTYHDPLSFSGASGVWKHHAAGPWRGIIHAGGIILRRSILSFDSIHNVLDLGAALVMLAAVTLCFVGPWKFPRHLLAYGIYAALYLLFPLLFSTTDNFPLVSLSRYVLEIFPAFILLATIGRNRDFNLGYLALSGSMLCALTLMFLTGRWIV